MADYKYIESDDYYDMACGWLKNKSLDKAEDCLLHAISLNPNFIHAYIDLAGIYARQQRFQDAVHILKKASQLDPGFDRVHYHMARYAYKNEDYANAKKFVQRASDIHPQERYDIFLLAAEERFRNRRH